VKPYWYPALFAVFAVFLAFGLNAWSRLETLSCDRDAKHLTCTMRRDAWLSSDAAFFPDVVDVRTLDLGRDQWALKLVGRRGETEDVVEEISEREAKDFIAAVVAGKAHVEVARERYPWRLAAFNFSMLVCLVGVAVGFLWQRRANRP